MTRQSPSAGMSQPESTLVNRLALQYEKPSRATRLPQIYDISRLSVCFFVKIAKISQMLTSLCLPGTRGNNQAPYMGSLSIASPTSCAIELIIGAERAGKEAVHAIFRTN